MAGCKSSSKSTIDQVLATQRSVMLADSLLQKQKQGIDFVGRGDEPVKWSLEIDFDKIIVFNAADGARLYVRPSFSAKEITNDAETYQLNTDLGNVTIKIFNKICTNNYEQFQKEVAISIKNKTYTGCGKYLYDHRVNDVWILDKINNIQQYSKDFTKGLPSIEFDLQNNRMTGSDGCNTMNANIEVQGNRIKFADIISTKMYCAGNKVQKIFSDNISNKLVDYYETNGTLVLYLVDDSKLIYKRKAL